ncbi:MAG TPA: hypothetical protein VN824_17520, partial [Puia sp.]|nr:hypothetical protein [Puia sp.]
MNLTFPSVRLSPVRATSCLILSVGLLLFGDLYAQPLALSGGAPAPVADTTLKSRAITDIQSHYDDYKKIA